MSARLRRKLAKEDPKYIRFERMWEKRAVNDPAFMIGFRCVAPVKYSRCKLCTGRPHCPPDFFYTDERK